MQEFMGLTAADITIAITVFSRRQFLKQAIGSALNQTVPVRVIVVEDCGPDAGMEAFVRQEFGSRIEYFRNPSRRGLFDNWNACLDYCKTQWLSILHDDDYLAPTFVESTIELGRHAPDCGLYFGQIVTVDESGKVLGNTRPQLEDRWQRFELADMLDVKTFPFAGIVFKTAYARAAGGFRKTSQYCGDWEMWCKIIGSYGSAQTQATMGFSRSHEGLERGTTKIHLNGRLRPLSFVQQKRIIHLLRQQGREIRFDREEFLRKAPMAVSELLRRACIWSPRMLRYHIELVRLSRAPSLPYATFQTISRVLGLPFVKAASWLAGHTGLDRRL
jgi:Glycosyltransferases involved in cell wall biogenesis